MLMMCNGQLEGDILFVDRHFRHVLSEFEYANRAFCILPRPELRIICLTTRFVRIRTSNLRPNERAPSTYVTTFVLTDGNEIETAVRQCTLISTFRLPNESKRKCFQSDPFAS
jgi:hypothetical protein